jgi:hypothetical protein
MAVGTFPRSLVTQNGVRRQSKYYNWYLLTEDIAAIYIIVISFIRIGGLISALLCQTLYAT